MAVTIKYTGTQIRWPELAITGKQSVWNPGQIESREDAEAALLLATGVFTDEGDKPLMLSGGDGLTIGGQALTAGQANALREGAETLKRPTFRDTFKRADTLAGTIGAANNSGVVYLNERAYPFSSPNLAANIGAVVAFEIFQTAGASTRYKCRVLEFSVWPDMILALRHTATTHRAGAAVIRARLVTQFAHGGIVIGSGLYHSNAAHGVHVERGADLSGYTLVDLGSEHDAQPQPVPTQSIQ